MKTFALAAILLVGLAPVAHARGLDYKLAPEEIADGVYVFWGLQEAWNTKNGGNIVNTGFIVGERAVLAIDTGTTRFYGEQMVAAIRAVSDKPIRHAVVTHHHPDHAFGIKQFKRANARVMMHPAAKTWLLREGSTVMGNMEIAMGQGWLAGTEVAKPNRLISSPIEIDLGGRTVYVIPMIGGHTAGDLIVIDEATGTLFAGDLVFNERAPSVPHADIPVWLDHLDTMADMNWQRLVPGHGPLITDASQFALMRDYLAYIQTTAQGAVARGEMLADALEISLPERFDGLSTLQTEFDRSMPSLFRKFEAEDFDAAVAVN
jgi:uncharacterized sulfatase